MRLSGAILFLMLVSQSAFANYFCNRNQLIAGNGERFSYSSDAECEKARSNSREGIICRSNRAYNAKGELLGHFYNIEDCFSSVIHAKNQLICIRHDLINAYGKPSAGRVLGFHDTDEECLKTLNDSRDGVFCGGNELTTNTGKGLNIFFNGADDCSTAIKTITNGKLCRRNEMFSITGEFIKLFHLPAECEAALASRSSASRYSKVPATGRP